MIHSLLTTKQRSEKGQAQELDWKWVEKVSNVQRETVKDRQNVWRTIAHNFIKKIRGGYKPLHLN